MNKTSTEKKPNFLQKYPVIPAIFFILFAWLILHFITPYKSALRDKNTMDNSPTIWKSDDSLATDWQLKITENYIYFKPSQQAVEQIYQYQTTQEPILTFEGVSTTRKSHIKIFVLPEKKGNKREAIITQETKCFYGFVKAIPQKKKEK